MGGSTELGGESLSHGGDLACIACDALLCFLPDSYPLVFQCENGHFLTLRDLLDVPLPVGSIACESAPTRWEGMALLFHRLAAHALKNGHAFAAADFQEAANRVDEWVHKLRVLQPERTPPAP